MKKILIAFFAFCKSIVPKINNSDSPEEEVETIEKLLLESNVLKPMAHQSIKIGFMGPMYKKTLKTETELHDTILIESEAEYMKITPHKIVYGYRSKHRIGHNKHYVVIHRSPLKYDEDKSNIMPTIAKAFLQNYITATSTSQAVMQKYAEVHN